jgi:hypothetical protein
MRTIKGGWQFAVRSGIESILYTWHLTANLRFFSSANLYADSCCVVLREVSLRPAESAHASRGSLIYFVLG